MATDKPIPKPKTMPMDSNSQRGGSHGRHEAFSRGVTKTVSHPPNPHHVKKMRGGSGC